MTYNELADEHGVHEDTIARVVRGETWRHLPGFSRRTKTGRRLIWQVHQLSDIGNAEFFDAPRLVVLDFKWAGGKKTQVGTLVGGDCFW
jgi:hypothetical protein